MTNSNQHLVVTISIESIVCLYNNVTLLLLCDEPTCTQSYTYYHRHWSYRIGLQHICTVYSYSIQVHTVHIVQYTGAYCTYMHNIQVHTVHIVQYTSTYCTYMHSIQVHTVHIVQYTGTYCTYMHSIQVHIVHIVQYTGTYCTYMHSTQVHTVYICTVYRYILYIYAQYTGTYCIP